MTLKVELPVFDGPLDLLLHLISKNKINIFDIPIVMITEQYLDYVRQMERQDMNLMSEFMVMASELISIKCKMLLPPEVDEEGEEIDPRSDLVRQLLEYKVYKFMSGRLREQMEDASQTFFRENTVPAEVLRYRPEVDPKELLAGLSLKKLHEVFASVLKRQENKVDPIRSGFGTIEREEVHMRDKVEHIVTYAKSHRRFSFRGLLNRQKGRMHVIVTLLAVLEMIRGGFLTVSQEAIDDDIELCRVEGTDFTEFSMGSEYEESGDGRIQAAG